MNRSLQLKSLIIGSPLEYAANRLRRVLELKSRISEPDLSEIFLEGARLPKILSRLLKNDSNCVDVGCHIGSFLSLLYAYSPDGQHVAIEALPSKAKALKAKFTNAIVHAVAVSDYNGTAHFEDNLHHPGHSRLVDGRPRDLDTRLVSVKVTRLDDILSGRIDFIKLDVEGAELSALQGAKDVIARWQPSILFECGSEFDMERSGLSRQDLFDFLTNDLKYRVYLFVDYLFDKGLMSSDEFRKAGMYPFRAFNFLALPVAMH